MPTYRKYKIAKLKTFAESKTPIEVDLVLDKTAVDFLLGLSGEYRVDHESVIEAIRRNIEKNGFRGGMPMHVSNQPELVDGRHRLLALKEAGYPENTGVRVIFGIEMRAEPALV